MTGNYIDISGRTHGFVDYKGAFTTIDDPQATYVTDITGINASGDLAGYYVDNNLNTHGFVDKNGTFTTIDDPQATAPTSWVSTPAVM